LLIEPKELEEIYYKNYCLLDYTKFLRKALNQQLIIKIQNQGITFELDKKITENYINNDFPDFFQNLLYG